MTFPLSVKAKDFSKNTVEVGILNRIFEPIAEERKKFCRDVKKFAYKPIFNSFIKKMKNAI